MDLRTPKERDSLCLNDQVVLLITKIADGFAYCEPLPEGHRLLDLHWHEKEKYWTDNMELIEKGY